MTFREYLMAKRCTTDGSIIEAAKARQPIFTPLPKAPVTRVLGAGGKWSVVQ